MRLDDSYEALGGNLELGVEIATALSSSERIDDGDVMFILVSSAEICICRRFDFVFSRFISKKPVMLA